MNCKFLTLFTILFNISLPTFADNYGISYVTDIHESSYSFSDNKQIEFFTEKYLEIGIFNPRFDATIGIGTSDSASAKKETRSINLIYKTTPFEQAKWLQFGLGGYFDISSITISNGLSYGLNDWYLRTQLGFVKSWDKSSFGLNIAPIFKVVSPSQSNQNTSTSRENVKTLASIYYAYEF